MKRIKRIGLILSIAIGALMAAVYVFSIIGLNTLLTYHQSLDDAIDWSPSITLDGKLNIIEAYLIISYILLACAVALKVVGFILFRLKKDDKSMAVTLITINAVNIAIKLISIIIAIPAVAYLNYVDATMQIKFIANTLFVAAQAAIIVWTCLYLTKLGRLKKELNNNQ